MQPRANQRLGRIPGPRGLPFLGNLPQLLPDPLPYVKHLHDRYGNVFFARFAGNRKVVFLLGPEATEMVLQDRAGLFSSAGGYADQSRYLGEQVLLFLDGAEHRALRQVLNPSFRTERLKSYLPAINRRIARAVRNWRQTPPADLALGIRELTLAVAIDVVVGAKPEREIPALNRKFLRVLAAMVSLNPLVRFRGRRTRAWLDRQLREQIPSRREATAFDLFTMLCQCSEAGGVQSDDEIVDNVIGLLVAAYETTASTISMMVCALAEHPSWQDRVRNEISRWTAPSGPSWADLDHLPETDWVLKEVLRLYPPISFIPRRTTGAVRVEGHTIPAGTPVIVSPGFVHQMESIYPQPTMFDPRRFAPGRVEDRAHRCAWVPFGKGAHTCLGMQLARMETKAFFAHLLKAVRVDATGTPPRMKYVPVLGPAGPLPVRFDPI